MHVAAIVSTVPPNPLGSSMVTDSARATLVEWPLVWNRDGLTQQVSDVVEEERRAGVSDPIQVVKSRNWFWIWWQSVGWLSPSPTLENRPAKECENANNGD